METVTTHETRGESLSGLTPAEAREFHQLYVQGFLGFTAVAVFAHILVWAWRPWIPGDKGYAALIDGVQTALTTASSLLA